jgi:hypothetical protein
LIASVTNFTKPCSKPEYGIDLNGGALAPVSPASKKGGPPSTGGASMHASPLRFLNAAAWPLTIWTSLTRLNDHPADDYVERTFPIMATAIAFWIAFAALVIFANPSVMHVVGSADGEELVGRMRRNWSSFVSVLWFFVPLIYLVGFWLFSSRDEAYPG